MMNYKIKIITAFVVIAAAFYGVACHPKNQQPVSLINDDKKGKPDSTVLLDTTKANILQGVDPCNGTGGTGQIVTVGNKTITIKRNDGINETINLTNKTTIRNSAGPIAVSDLKTGNRVTVVVMSHHTATVVLVCNASGSNQ